MNVAHGASAVVTTALFSSPVVQLKAAVALVAILFTHSLPLSISSGARLRCSAVWAGLKCGDPSGSVRTFNKVSEASQFIYSHYTPPLYLIINFFILVLCNDSVWPDELFMRHNVDRMERKIKADSVPEDRKRQAIDTERPDGCGFGILFNSKAGKLLICCWPVL